jgi:hypothetical protein
MPGKYSGNVTVSHPDVPYYSQWESPELVGRFLDGSLRAADDPRWAASGAATPDEYAFWARRVCGLACLKMLLAWQGEPVPTSMALVRRALACGAYVRDGDRVRGLIYQPFVAWIGAEYGIAAQVMRELPVESVVRHARAGTLVVASVHPWVRWPQRVPPARGGHLVLVTGLEDGKLRFHNPSGLPGVSQRHALAGSADFARFAAGRGIVVRG